MYNKSDEKKIYIFFFKSVQIYIKDAECSETNEKSKFSNFIFRVMVIFILKYGQFPMNFHDNSEKKLEICIYSFVLQRFSTIWTRKIITALFEGGWEEGVCRSLTRNNSFLLHIVGAIGK